MEVGPSSQTMEKCHLSWSDFMVHGVNRPCVQLRNGRDNQDGRIANCAIQTRNASNCEEVLKGSELQSRKHFDGKEHGT
jgi:hypothetical protein